MTVNVSCYSDGNMNVRIGVITVLKYVVDFKYALTMALSNRPIRGSLFAFCFVGFLFIFVVCLFCFVVFLFVFGGFYLVVVVLFLFKNVLCILATTT